MTVIAMTSRISATAPTIANIQIGIVLLVIGDKFVDGEVVAFDVQERPIGASH